MDFQVHRTRDSPMVCPGRRFSRSAFFPKRPPIKIIKIFKMIKMIWDRLDRDTLHEGLRGGGQVGDILNFRGFGSGQMYGICLWFRRVSIFSIRIFPTSLYSLQFEF